MTDPVRSNWAGNYTYCATGWHDPATLDELRRVVADAGRIRVIGSRHSFNDIADSVELVSLHELPHNVVIDRERATVTCSAAITYGALAVVLDDAGLALHNMASLPHISVGGAVTTATHGSGDANGNLATAVLGIEMVTSSGDVLSASRGDADFEGMVVGLGALGALTRLTLDVEPAYLVRQTVYERLSWDAFIANFDAVMSLGYSVSAFTDWTDDIAQLWVKSRVTADGRDHDPPSPSSSPSSVFGAARAAGDRHPVPGASPAACTPQGGVPGSWLDRLPHFRTGFTPSRGDEIQSEFHVPRADGLGAIAAVRGLGADIAEHLLVSEIRTVAADTLWMSPQYERDSVALHFTWRLHPAAVRDLLLRIEEVLAPFGARPHWGKVFVAEAPATALLYPRRDDFVALAARLDGRGAFRNEWFERTIVA